MKEIELTVSPELGFDEENLSRFLISKGKISNEEHFQINRRSIDARGKKVKVHLRILVGPQVSETLFIEYEPLKKSVENSPNVLIVGAGPAGLFAALKAIELGLKPIILERGKDVRSRRRDIAAINKDHLVNPESNYCFGEGGAGTYSDGKLYTRSRKRGNIRRIFEILVAHGAPENILWEAHPHIGTNKLPKIVAAMREEILAFGGEIHFYTRVDDLIIRSGKVQGVLTAGGSRISGEAVVLATGHSARDIYFLLERKKIALEIKPFALGVRVEHPQGLIDEIQYSGPRGEYLPASSYSLVSQSHLEKVDRGVFSFCMCPGGFIVPAATNPGEVVVNGMSPSRRDSKYANSGIVVEIRPEDVPLYSKRGNLGLLDFQAEIEKKACEVAGKSQNAPAQRLTDFLEGKVSTKLNETSYQPGVTSSDVSEIFPAGVSNRLKQGFKMFGKRMKGYVTNDAQILGVESRTSSPVKIPRDDNTLQHPEISRLYPCGEGAGYAGGIVSAALDGERVMTAVAHNILKHE